MELFIDRTEWRKGPAGVGRVGCLEHPWVQELCSGLGEAQTPPCAPRPSSVPCRAVSAGGSGQREPGPLSLVYMTLPLPMSEHPNVLL